LHVHPVAGTEQSGHGDLGGRIQADRAHSHRHEDGEVRLLRQRGACDQGVGGDVHGGDPADHLDRRGGHGVAHGICGQRAHHIGGDGLAGADRARRPCKQRLRGRGIAGQANGPCDLRLRRSAQFAQAQSQEAGGRGHPHSNSQLRPHSEPHVSPPQRFAP
jgi:hypothetical protein